MEMLLNRMSVDVFSYDVSIKFSDVSGRESPSMCSGSIVSSGEWSRKGYAPPLLIPVSAKLTIFDHVIVLRNAG